MLCTQNQTPALTVYWSLLDLSCQGVPVGTRQNLCPPAMTLFCCEVDRMVRFLSESRWSLPHFPAWTRVEIGLPVDPFHVESELKSPRLPTQADGS